MAKARIDQNNLDLLEMPHAIELRSAFPERVQRYVGLSPHGRAWVKHALHRMQERHSMGFSLSDYWELVERCKNSSRHTWQVASNGMYDIPLEIGGEVVYVVYHPYHQLVATVAPKGRERVSRPVAS